MSRQYSDEKYFTLMRYNTETPGVFITYEDNIEDNYVYKNITKSIADIKIIYGDLASNFYYFNYVLSLVDLNTYKNKLVRFTFYTSSDSSDSSESKRHYNVYQLISIPATDYNVINAFTGIAECRFVYNPDIITT